MALTDTKARQAKPKTRVYRLADGHGLYLEVMPTGARYWRLKYRFHGKEKRLALGVYPEVSVAEARRCAQSARQMLRDGDDPSERRKAAKREAKLAVSNNFEAVARAWHEVACGKWTADHAERVMNSLKRDVFSQIGHRPITALRAPECLELLRKIEGRGARDMARRVKQRLESVFAYAIACGIAEDNPVASMRGVLAQGKAQPRKMLPRSELPAFLVSLDGYQGDPLTRLALKLVLLTFVRTNEARGARWAEFDTENAIWLIPGERMKSGLPHAVPLCPQAIELLSEIKKLSGAGELLFPGRSDYRKTISQNTLIYALYRMGLHSRATVHGFRALASTVLNESGRWSADAIERQLAHKEKDEIRAAYHRAQYLEERTRMMRWWAEFLDVERAKGAGQNVVALRKG